jgi:HAE1 family hydrophobic/amphiphilic exporter-1
LPLLLGLCAIAFFVNNTVPSGFIPEEDQGMIYAVIETPPGSTIERTNKVAHELLDIAEKEDGVESVSSLAGYEILSEGTSANSGSCLINLKSWKDRKHSAKEIIDDLQKKCRSYHRCRHRVLPAAFDTGLRRRIGISNSVCSTRRATMTIIRWRR